MMNVSRPLAGLRFLAGFAALILSQVISAQPQKIAYDIPAQSLESALTQFGVQSKRQLVFDPDTVPARTTPAVKGEYAPLEALDILIGNSGLTYSVDGKDTIIVRRITAASSAADSSLRLVQSDSPVNAQNTESQNPESEKSTSETSAEVEENKLQEVVVTGTHIRGAKTSSPLTVITKTEIARSGFSTVSEVINSLPQMSGAGQNATAVAVPGDRNTGNAGLINSPNLRGLGSSATLTLINGQRIAPSGFRNSVDISILPIAAIERVEVLSDGASAIYGSDAVAGVVNIILQKEFDGLESSALLSGTADGGAFEKQGSQTAGASWSSGNIVADYQYRHQNPLRAGDRSYTQTADQNLTLIPTAEQHSGFLYLQQNLTDTADLFAQVLLSSRSNLQGFGTGSFQFPITVDVNQRSGSMGLNWKIFDSIHSLTSLTASIDRVASASDFNDDRYRNRYWSVNQKLDGTITQLRTGPLKAAMGGGYSESKLDYAGLRTPTVSRSQTFVYGEVRIPVVAADRTRRGLNSLDIDASVRWERYNDFGSSANPKFGISYAPLGNLLLRTTWGTSLRAPTIFDLNSPVNGFVINAEDSESQTPTTTVVLLGANDGLKPEKSTSFTIGVEYRPEHAASLELRADYFRIRYQDLQSAPAVFATALIDPKYAPFVTRVASSDQIDATIDRIAENGGTLFDFRFAGTPLDPASISAIVDATVQNISAQRASGIDLSARYIGELGSFGLDVFGGLTFTKIEQKLLDSLQFSTFSGKVFNLPEVKGRVGVTLHSSSISVSVFENYIDGSVDDLSVPARKVSDWFTTDGQVAYSFGRQELGGRVALSVVNLFDHEPPRIGPGAALATGIWFDSANASALGRTVRGSVSVRW